MEIWKELARREELGENAPLQTTPPCAGASPKRSSDAVDADDMDLLYSGFTPQEISPQMVRIWSVFQVIAVLVQCGLWMEISRQLSTFEDAVARECVSGHVRHGVCTGPMWNLSTWQDVNFSDDIWSGQREHVFDFSIRSLPPTFLMVVVPASAGPPSSEVPSAVEDLNRVEWEYEMTRISPPGIEGKSGKGHQTGVKALAFEDLSTDAHAAILDGKSVDWRASISLRHRYRRSRAGNVRMVAYVEDANIPHLNDIHASRQCIFGVAWKAFNEQHQGRSHQKLRWCRCLLGAFLPLTCFFLLMVHREHAPQNQDRRKFGLHFIVIAKFFLMDMPQQVCIVLYLLGWYDRNGLKCQLCLFDPRYCSDESPLRGVNVVAALCTLCSCVVNQLLVRALRNKTYTDDDVFCQHVFRLGVLCMSILPFSCGLWWASSSILENAFIVHLLISPLCFIGLITLLMMITTSVCLPLAWLTDEEEPDWKPKHQPHPHMQYRVVHPRAPSRKRRSHRHRF